MRTLSFALLSLALWTGCGKQETPANQARQSSDSAAVQTPSMDLHEAALRGDVEAVRRHVAAGSDLDGVEAVSGSTPLFVAATFGQTEVAHALIEAGADVNARNNEGATPLITAAFFCHPEVVELLLANGADKNARNNVGASALDSVSAPFESVKGVYDFVGAALAPAGLQLDYERLQATRPKIAEMLR